MVEEIQTGQGIGFDLLPHSLGGEGDKQTRKVRPVRK
jgi:hypothetical protein